MGMFRILSLDGGGLMGAFSASVLATLERTTGRRLVDHFDLITGTSTGGIIAIGLGMGASAEQILRFYEEQGAAIFPPAKGVGGWLKTLRKLTPAQVLTGGAPQGDCVGRGRRAAQGGADATGDPGL